MSAYVDHVSRGGSTLGQGAITHKSQPFPQMWHETLFDELKASMQKERSVAFKIRQNAFPPGALPQTLLGAHDAP